MSKFIKTEDILGSIFFRSLSIKKQLRLLTKRVKLYYTILKQLSVYWTLFIIWPNKLLHKFIKRIYCLILFFVNYILKKEEKNNGKNQI